MALVTKNALRRKGKPTVGTELVEVEGGEVRVRGLTRGEFHDLQVAIDAERDAAAAAGKPFNESQARELRIVAAGMHSPTMTVDEVQEWSDQPGAAGEIQDVSIAIGKLSRLVKEAAKAVTKSTDGGSGG